MLYNPKLTDSVIYMNLRVAQSVGSNTPLVVVAAVAVVDDPHVVGLDDPKVLVGGAPWYHVGLIPFRQLILKAAGEADKGRIFAGRLRRLYLFTRYASPCGKPVLEGLKHRQKKCSLSS